MRATSAEFKVVRMHSAMTAAAEKRLLVWMAERVPGFINSDHLTFAGALALLAAGASLWAGGAARPSPGGGSLWAGGAALALVIPLLVVNWLGDSLDGTLARVRHRERPRYGYYVDHVLDAVGFAAVTGGLILGGHMTPVIGLGFLAAYYLVVVEVALATHARGTFRISAFGMGPTELRILLAAGTVPLMRSGLVEIAGHRWLLFDVGAAAGIAGLLLTFAYFAMVS